MMGSAKVGSRRDSLLAKLIKLEGRDCVRGEGVVEPVGGGFGVLERAAKILSMTLPTFSLPGGRERNDRLFSCFSLRSLSAFLRSFSSPFRFLASSFSFLFLSRLSRVVGVPVAVAVCGERGRNSSGTKPGGYETMWMECGRRERGSISGAGKAPGLARRLRSAGRLGE
jgi:hypothetical protein